MKPSPPRVAIAGLGGFAEDHHSALASLESEGRCRVVAACDPNLNRPDRFRLAERGLKLYNSFEDLLAAHRSELDLVTLPTPIPRHAEQHRLAVESGAPVYLEKPPSLWWPEFESMLTVERIASKSTHVGFNFIGDPMRRALKQRILAGEFGALRLATLHAVWPRQASYYRRNDWAGCFRVGEQWVVDSVIGNALAHYVQNLLYWSGEGSVDAVGTIRDLRAWLARTRPIESFDTALVQASMASGATIRIAATHAELPTVFDRETLEFEHATIVFGRWNEANVRWEDGRAETSMSAIPDHAAMLRFNLGDQLDYLAGRRTRPTTRLEDATSFVALCGLALISTAEIHSIESPPNLGDFAADGVWPTAIPPMVTPSDLPRLEESASRILSAYGGPKRLL